MKHWPGVFIIIISATLMQVHSIAFWVEYAGFTGAGFSLALEVAALWLWWQRCSWLAVIASALLIGGPLFQLSAPVLDSIYQNNNNQQLVSVYKKEVQQLSESLTRYDENSGQRLGWAERIDKTQHELTQARKNLKEALSQPINNTPSQLYFVVLMQALALIVIMRTQIIAIKKLPFIPVIVTQQSRNITNTKNLRFIKKTQQAKPLTDFDKRVIAVADQIKQRLPEFEGRQKKLADHIKVRPADISMALKYLERENKSGNAISLPALEKMEKAMSELVA